MLIDPIFVFHFGEEWHDTFWLIINYIYKGNMFSVDIRKDDKKRKKLKEKNKNKEKMRDKNRSK